MSTYSGHLTRTSHRGIISSVYIIKDTHTPDKKMEVHMGKVEENQEKKILEIIEGIREDLIFCKDDWRFIVQMQTIVKKHKKKRKS